LDDPDFSRHVQLMQSLTSQGVSSDESDSGDDTSHKAFRRISPAWRSEDLQGFMWALDCVIQANRRPKVSHCSIRGAEPRRRLLGSTKNDNAIAPPGLPRNCYDEAWLSTLTAKELRMLNVRDAYDFTIGKGRRQAPSMGTSPGGPPIN